CRPDPATPSEPPAEPAELALLARRERIHLAHEQGHVPGEEVTDEPTALVGETDRDEAAIVTTPGPTHQSTECEIADHHGDVAAAAQQLASEIALAERAQVQQRLQGAELADGQSDRGH